MIWLHDHRVSTISPDLVSPKMTNRVVISDPRIVFILKICFDPKFCVDHTHFRCGAIYSVSNDAAFVNKRLNGRGVRCGGIQVCWPEI